MQFFRVIAVIVGIALINSPVSAELPDLSGMAEEILAGDPRNAGIEFSVAAAPEYGADVVALTIESVADNKSRADLIRVVLQCLVRLSAVTPEPAMLVVKSDSTEQLLMEGAHLSSIKFQMDAGKPMPAWTMFIENSVRPDGSKIELPQALLPRTTAALEAVSLITPSVRSTTAGASSAKSDGVDPELAAAAESDGAEMIGMWLYQEEEDPVDETFRQIVIGKSDTDEGDSAALVIGCFQVRKTKREMKKDPGGSAFKYQSRLGIQWNEYLGNDDYKKVTFRLDDQEPQSMSMYNTDRTTIISSTEAKTFISKLLDSERFIVRITPYNDPSETAIFSLSGLAEAVEPMKENCGW